MLLRLGILGRNISTQEKSVKKQMKWQPAFDEESFLIRTKECTNNNIFSQCGRDATCIPGMG